MANVHFLKGTQTSFNNLTSFQEGAFYLTTDTNRLYFANSTTAANYLNKYVHTITTEDELKSAINDGILMAGDFAYVSNKNALVAVTANKSYTQINAYTDTNDDTQVSQVTFTKATSDADNTITFSFKLNQTTHDVDGDTTGGPEVTSSFTITGDDIKAIIPACAVNVGATIASNKATVKTSGQGSAGTGFTIAGAGSVTVGGTSNAVTITGTNTTYDLGSAEGSTNITLTDSDSESQNVAFVAGTQIALDGSAENQIIVNHGTIGKNDTTSSQAATPAGTFTVIDSITRDNGHVTGVNTKTITLPEADTYSITDIDASKGDGKLYITLADKDGQGSAVASDADFFYTVGKDTKVTKFIGSDLGVYTIDEIDSKMKNLNAMVYKGTVGTGGTVTTLPTSKVSAGDTYMTKVAGTYGTHACGVGDLLIATGTEGEDGYLTTITWTYVPSANDTDTQYELAVAAGSDQATIQLKASTDGDATSAIIKAGTDIDVSASGSTITVTHAPQTTTPDNSSTETLTHTGKFRAVTGVTTSNGHLTGYETTEFTMPADNNSTYSLVGASNKITLDGSDGDDSSISLSVGTDITASIANNTLSIAHKAKSTGSATDSATLTPGGTFQAISAVATDNGHVKTITTKTYTLPEQLEYTLSGIAVTGTNNALTLKTTLSDSDNGSSVASLGINSSSLTLTAGTNSYSIDLVWGTF